MRRTSRWIELARAAGLALAAACVLIGARAPSAAAPYPSRPIRLVVGFLAGGPTDIPARFVADRLSQQLGQKVYVENRPGAGGMLALNEVLAQPRDGYSLLLCTYFDAMNPLLHKDVSYKLSDLAPVALISKYYYLMAAANAVPVETFDQFVGYAKAHPGKILYGTVGAGSTQELIAHQLEQAAGITMTKVPFKGANEINQEMLAGRVQFQVGPPFAIGPYYASHQLKVLATTSPQRLTSFPDVPTLSELGFALTPYAWLGVCAGAGTPQPILARLNRHIVAITRSDDYRRFMEKAGNVPASSTPAELARVIAETAAQAAPVIRKFHMQVQ